VFGPLIGRAADKFGKFRVFTVGTLLSMTMVQIYTHLDPVPLPVLIAVNAVLFVGIFSRMIPFQAIVAGVPTPAQRGAFNAISSSVQQLSGGIASVIAGHIVTLGADGRLQHFDRIGHVVVGASIVSFMLLWRLQKSVAAG
jgi:MFS family permease